MSTLLDNSSRPLWVWIVVIVVGSLFILGITTWLIRHWILRQRTRSDIEFISDEPAEKKLTLRRGRIVPATSYLSLTGSRFGVGSSAGDDGRQTPSVRSKSPFEWWAGLKGRSSRLSYVSHVSSTHYPSSPRPGSFYQRPDLSTSKLSLTSKDENLRATVVEVKVTKPQTTLLVPSLKRSSRNFEPVNFSRSFMPQPQRPHVIQHTKTLSRISENTPRQSMFSTASFKLRANSLTPSEQGQPVEQATPRASGLSLLNVPMPNNHSRKASASSSREMLQREHDHPLAQNPPGFTSSPYFASIPNSPTFPPATVEPASLPVQRQSLWESSMKQFPSLEHHHDPTRNSIQPSAFPEAAYAQSQPGMQKQPVVSEPARDLEAQYYDEASTQHHASQTIPTIPSGPLRTRSKKGNVLRKKSLERNRVLSVQA